MPNGAHTFKHRGQTFGLEEIFSASEARAEMYMAFGQEKSFLGKLLGLGFVTHGDDVYHPAHWTPIAENARGGFYTHTFRPSTGGCRLGRKRSIVRRR